MSNAIALNMQISASVAGLQRAVAQTEQLFNKLTMDTKKTQKSLSQIKFFTGVTAALAGAQKFQAVFGQINGALGGFVRAASDASQAGIKAQQVFGASAQSVQEFADAAAVVGVASTQALSAASSFGNLFTSFGAGRAEAAALSTDLVALAADLAAFNNTSIEEALAKIESGLVGQSKPLREFGISVDQATLKTIAFNEGLIDSKSEALDPLTRAYAAYVAIQEQSANAQGQALRETEEYNQQVKILQAEFSTLAGQLGETLTPVFQAFTAAAIALAPTIKELIGDFAAWVNTVDWSSVTASLVDLGKGFFDIVAVLGQVVFFFTDLATNILGPVVALFGGLGNVLKIVAGAVAGGALAWVGFNAGMALSAITIPAGVTLLGALSAAFTAMWTAATAGIGGILIAIGVVVGALTAWWFGTKKVQDSNDDLIKQQQDMAKAAEDYEKKQKQFDEDRKKALKEQIELQRIKNNTFEITNFKDFDIAKSSAESATKAYEKLATQLGSIAAVPKELTKQYQELRSVQEEYNEAVRNGADPGTLDEIIKKSKELEASIQARVDAIKAETKALEEQRKANEALIDRVQKLAEEGKSPLQKANEKRAQELKDIEDYRILMQQQINDLQAKGDAASLASAKKLYEETQQTINLYKKASQEAYDQATKATENATGAANEVQKSAIEAAGLQASQFERQLSQVEQFSAELGKALDLRKAGEITTDQLKNFIKNSTDQISDFYREIQEKNALVDRSLLKANDLSTEAGVAEFFRLASGQEDPAAESNRKQLRELQQIKKVLIDNGLKPVDIL